MQQYIESIRLFEAIAARSVSDHLDKPKQVDFLRDADGRIVAYFNFTAASGQSDGDVACFIRTMNPLPDEVTNSFIARSNTPNHIVPPSPIFEIWIQDGLLSSDLGVVAYEFLHFIRMKSARNAILKVVDGEHPKLKGIFGETADSAATERSAVMSVGAGVGGN